MTPIIGITTNDTYENKIDSVYYDEYFHIARPYIDAVRRAGGIPVLIPPGESQWESLLPSLNGVIITGGSDIDPNHYQGNPEHPNLTRFFPERDTMELALARHLVASKDKPVLCICRGMQVLNVAIDGTMHEHIPDMGIGDIHRDPEGLWTTHDVHVEPDSELCRVMGTTTVHTYSGHHQAIKTVGAGLQVTATAPDGIIEALTSPDHPWLLAVQWHPEISAADDPTQQRLFDGLVEATRQPSRV